MFNKLNPSRIICAHWKSFRNDAVDQISWDEVLMHALLPAILSFIYSWYGKGITEGIAGIIVSAASISAGLLLNLLVLIYTLIYNAKSAVTKISNFAALKTVADEALATIGYSILLSLCLVLTAFLSLAQHDYASTVGEFLTIYIGCSTVLCILIVLKRVFALVDFEIQR